MKVVVTGGAGFIGSHLVDRLIEVGHEVLVIDDLSGGSLQNLLRDEAGAQNFQRGSHPEGVAQELRFQKHSLGGADMGTLKADLCDCEVLYHLAADATEGRSQFTPWRCTMDGLAASAQVFAAAAAVGVKRIVFTSSMAVYGDQEAPFTEEMEPRPVDVYGVNKHAAERMLQILAETHGFEYVILRPHNVYGPRQNAADRYRNVVTIFINRLLRGQPIQIYGSGEQQRAFTWIGDMIGQVAEAGWRPEVVNQIFNVGTDVPSSIIVLGMAVAEAMGLRVEDLSKWSEFIPARPCEVHQAYCDNSKWWRVTGQEPPVPMPLASGIRAVVEWMKEIGVHEPPYMEMEIPSEKVPEPWRKS